MRSALALVALLAICQQAAQAEDLPLNQMVEGSTNPAEPAVYAFTAPGPGALTVVVRAPAGTSNVLIRVTDSIGQPLVGGLIDVNYQQNAAAEQGVVPIPHEGEYEVRVESYEGRAVFNVSATWLPFDALLQPEDPDGSPLTAIELGLNEWYEEDLQNSMGDMVDWFKLEAEAAGSYEVRTQADHGDLILEGYRDDEFISSFFRSDSDLNGNTASEKIEVELEAGEVVYFKLTSYGGDIDYEIKASMPE